MKFTALEPRSSDSQKADDLENFHLDYPEDYFHYNDSVGFAGWTKDMYTTFVFPRPKYPDSTTRFFSDTENRTYVLDAPPLRIAFASEMAMNSGNDFYLEWMGNIFNYTEVERRAVCQTENAYKWGFSQQLTSAFLITTIVLVAVSYPIWLLGLIEADKTTPDVVFGSFRTALIVSRAIHESLGDRCDTMSDEALVEGMKAPGAGITLHPKGGANELDGLQEQPLLRTGLSLPPDAVDAAIPEPVLARYQRRSSHHMAGGTGGERDVAGGGW